VSSHSGFFILNKPTGHPLLKKSHYEGGAVIGPLTLRTGVPLSSLSGSIF